MPEKAKKTFRVFVEYDCRGQRTLKEFSDVYAARRFAMTKEKAGKRPQYINPDRIEDRTMAAKKTTKATENTSDEKQSKPKAERDQFGNRIGTQAAQINAAVTHTPATAKQIAEQLKLNPSRVNTHLRWLLERDHVEKTDDGFKLKGEQKPKRTRRTRKTKSN